MTTITENTEIDAVTSTATGEVFVVFGKDEPIVHTIQFEKRESNAKKVFAIIDGVTGVAANKEPAAKKALEQIYTVNFNATSNTENFTSTDLVQIKRNKPAPVADDLTDEQAEKLSTYDDVIADNLEALSGAERQTRSSTRAIGSALFEARTWLNASVVAADETGKVTQASNARWGQYTSKFEIFKTSKNALSELTAVGEMSAALFAVIPDGKDGAKTIGTWVNERRNELAKNTASDLKSVEFASTKGLKAVRDFLATISSGEDVADKNLQALKVLATQFHAEIDGLEFEKIVKTKFGAALVRQIAARVIEQKSDEVKETEKTEKATAQVTKAFAEMLPADAVDHLAKILFSHDEYADIHDMLGDKLKELQAAADEKQDVADEGDIEDADGDLG